MSDNSHQSKTGSRLTFGAIILFALTIIGLYADMVDLGFMKSPTNHTDSPQIITQIPEQAPFQAQPTFTLIPTSVPSFYCPNALPTRLHIGDTGRVLTDPPSHNLLKHRPSQSSDAFERIEIGRTFTVLDGPVCDGTAVYWYVRSYEDVVGWTAESNDYTYYVEPL